MKRFENKTDEEIAAWAQQGDEEALTFLLLKYKNFVRARVRTYFLIGADQDDLLQEGMIGLYKAIRDFDSQRSSFIAFAELCITRHIITTVKSASRQKHLPLNQSVSLNRSMPVEGSERDLFDITAALNVLDPEDIVVGEESRAALVDYLQKELSAFEYEVLCLYLQGFTYTQIGSSMDRPEKSIDNALQRIKSKISAYLRETPAKSR